VTHFCVSFLDGIGLDEGGVIFFAGVVQVGKEGCWQEKRMRELKGDDGEKCC